MVKYLKIVFSIIIGPKWTEMKRLLNGLYKVCIYMYSPCCSTNMATPSSSCYWLVKSSKIISFTIIEKNELKHLWDGLYKVWIIVSVGQLSWLSQAVLFSYWTILKKSSTRKQSDQIKKTKLYIKYLQFCQLCCH